MLKVMSVEKKSPERSSQIIKNVLMNWVAFAATIITGFLMSPFLVHNLGDAVYGVWVLLGSLVGYMGLLDFGLTVSTVKYVAEHRARGDQEAINKVMSGSLAVYSAVGLLTLFIGGAVSFYFNDIFNSPLSRNVAAAAVILATINQAISFPAAVFVGMIRGYQRYDLDAGVTAVTIAVRSALVVVLVKMGYGILALSAVTFAFDIVRMAYLAWWCYRLNPAIVIARKYIDAAHLRTLLGYSSLVFVIVIAKRMIFFTDSIVVGAFLSTAAVTAYFVGNRLVLYLHSLVSEMVGVLTPAASDLDARNQHGAIKELVIISTKYTLLLALPASAIFFILGGIFIELWMGPAYKGSWLIMIILTAGILAHLIEMPSHTMLLGRGKHRIVAKLTFAQAIANLGLSLLLVKPLGMKGVALGTSIPMIVFTAIAIPVYFRYLAIPLGEFVRNSIASPIVVQAPFIGLVLAIKYFSPPTTLLLFFVEISVAFSAYAVLAISVCLSKDERRAFLRLAERFGFKASPNFS